MITSNRRLSPLNPLSWSIWLKLLIGFSLIVVVLVFPAVLLVQIGLQEVSLQNARSFASENGLRQLTNVTNALDRARDNVENFAADSVNQQLMTSLLLRDVRTNFDIGLLGNITGQDVSDALTTRLLNPATSLFDNVRLLDRDGRVVSQAGQNAPGVALIDQSDSDAYQQALTDPNEQNTLLVISERNFPILEYVTRIRWRDGETIGYLVSQLSNSRALYTNIRFRYTGASFNAFAFLTSDDGILFSPIESRELSVNSFNATGTRRALSGQTGVDIYSLSIPQEGTAPLREEVVGYYAPVPGTRLVLVSQVPTAVTYQESLDIFAVRGFVVLIGAIMLVVLLSLLINQLITPALNRLRSAAVGISAGDYTISVPETARGDEIGAAAMAFTQMRTRVKSTIDELESRIALRTRDIEATQEISRYVATQRDEQSLMDNVVRLIIDRFPVIYHAQIFLIDTDHVYAVVRASTGEIGMRLLERGHRLPIGSVSVIGQVTDQGKTILAKDTAVSQVHRRNEFLPNTRSELAIPLRVTDTIIGALDVQSEQSDAFPDDLIRVLETMADQIAIAIQNARLYQESMRRVREIEDINRQATVRAWQDYMSAQRVRELIGQAGVYDALDSTARSEMSDLRQRALIEKRAIVGDVTERNTVPIAVPIELRGQMLGAVEWEIPANDISGSQIDLAQELANRLAISLDNARLFQESRRATERERLVNSIAARLTQTTNIDNILQTAVREVGQALRSPQVSIHLNHAGDLEDGKPDA